MVATLATISTTTNITFSLASSSTISTTTITNPGFVYASAIQVRWKSSDNLYSHSLSRGAKAGIGVGAVLTCFLIVGIIVWVVHQRRLRRQQSFKAEGISHGEPTTFTGKPELQASKPTEALPTSTTSPEASSGAGFPKPGGINIATSSVRETSSDAAGIEGHSRSNLGQDQMSNPNLIMPSELAESVSITSDPAIKRKQVLVSKQRVTQPATSDLGQTAHPRPTSNLDSASLSQTTQRDSLPPPENFVAEDAE